MSDALLLVLAGRPGTGKTTLSHLLAATLHAAVLRVDAIETAVVRAGLATHPVGPIGYMVVHEIAQATLVAGTAVIVDAVNPVPEARAGWRELASSTGARLLVLETVLTNVAEHRRRVTARRPDLDGQRIPTWDDVVAAEYIDWDEARDGARTVLDTTDLQAAHDGVVALISRFDTP